MSRSYTNTLLFESALDVINSSNPILFNVAQSIFKPTVKIVEEDCETLLGKSVPSYFRSEGMIEIETGLPLTSARLFTLITSGNPTVNVRSLNTCISEGGVCRRCYVASRPDDAGKTVGQFVKVVPEVVLDVSQFAIATGQTVIQTPYSSENFDKVHIFENGLLIPSSAYTISGTDIVLNTASPSDTLFVVKYIVYSNSPFYHWVTYGFAGSLLGVKPLYKPELPLTQKLLTASIPTEDVNSLVKQLQSTSISSEDSIQYVSTIKDPLEKAVYAVLLGALFLNT